MAELVVEQLTKIFPTRGEPLEVLRGIDLSLARGESLAIVGPSGSGKSTLLHILGTLERPTSGRVRLAGDDPFALDDTALARFRNRRVGFVFQDHHLLPQCSVRENVLLPVLATGPATREHLDRAEQLIARVGLAARRDHRPSELSGGERQRAAIARALIQSPLLLLADEPTGNLDRVTARAVTDLLLEIQTQENAMLIAVTHSQDLAERMTYRSELDSGRLVPADGVPSARSR